MISNEATECIPLVEDQTELSRTEIQIQIQILASGPLLHTAARPCRGLVVDVDLISTPTRASRAESACHDRSSAHARRIASLDVHSTPGRQHLRALAHRGRGDRDYEGP
ncbi:hypothetical protein PMIN07_005379 [Paraphaeosphaeria minitans]